ncbi:MAG: hypothetical protein ABEJ56_05110 [Candidatus Nanohaloarchaea archaeon]
MIAGLMLSDSEKEDSQLALLGDETDSLSLKDTGRIVDEISGREVEVLAVNCGTELNAGELTEDEEELKEAGYAFTPSHTEKKKVERLRAIERSLKHLMDKPTELIRFDPAITSEKLALDSDDSLESLGVDASDISSSKQFDAVLGAITARFYSQNHYSDEGLIVPEKLENGKT